MHLSSTMFVDEQPKNFILLTCRNEDEKESICKRLRISIDIKLIDVVIEFEERLFSGGKEHFTAIYSEDGSLIAEVSESFEDIEKLIKESKEKCH